MGYTEQEHQRILALKAQIEANRGAYRAATYRDVPALQELAGLLRSQPQDDELCDSRAAYRYLAECYVEMERFGTAAVFYENAIDCACALGDSVLSDPNSKKQLENDIRLTVRARNMYAGLHLMCEDLMAKATPLLSMPKVHKLIQDGLREVRVFYDPVEMTEDYLAVIDKIEEQIDKELGTEPHLGRCRAVWKLKQDLLEKAGIEWRSPAVMNPDVRFD